MSSNEWFTPLRYIQAVREVFGGRIALDPASCAFANKIVQAERYFTIEDNGLDREWHAASVFCNPPYGKTKRGGSNLELFCRHADEQYRRGNAREMILLIPTNTATSWFPVLWAYPICFPSFRIRFYTEQGVSDGASFGTCFVYMGPNIQRFIDVFSRFGHIARSVTIDRATPAPASLWTGEEVCHAN